MFGNACLKDRLDFEGTTAAIVMAGLVFAFFTDYGCHRLKESNMIAASSKFNDEFVNLIILELGIIFHSVCKLSCRVPTKVRTDKSLVVIGVTLVVSGDSFFITLFIVILFHQMFEGIALGTRIAAYRRPQPSAPTNESPQQSANPKTEANNSGNSSTSLVTPSSPNGASLWIKILGAAIFGFTTPIGMAIGISVLKRFNGQDPDTLIAIGTLDALSAGILLWVGIVEMWAHDWVFKEGELVNAGAVQTACASFGLLAGMALMSFLGKWA